MCLLTWTMAFCPAKHTLKRFETDHSDFECDECSETLQTGGIAWGCRLCNYDVCSICHVEAQVVDNDDNRTMQTTEIEPIDDEPPSVSGQNASNVSLFASYPRSTAAIHFLRCFNRERSQYNGATSPKNLNHPSSKWQFVRTSQSANTSKHSNTR